MRKKRVSRFFKKLFLFSFIIVFLGTIFLAIFAIRWINNLPVPDFESFEERKVIQSTKIYDRTGKNLLYDIHENIKRTVIPYEDVPRHLKNATVAIEDAQFYEHGGFQIKSYIRAFWANMGTGDRGQGGSTITQQLVKNTFLTTEKTYTRKIKEVILAVKMEKVFSKEEIITLYLNEIPYGGSNYGIEAAANSFFGKSASDLSLAECAYLAALPQAPTRYSPYGLHVDELENRKNLVIQKMLDLGFIDTDEFKQATNEKVVFLNQSEKGIRAPHFVMYIKNIIEEKYGKDVVEQGGLKITTTLNLDLQEEAENMAKKYMEEIEEKFNATNVGLVGMDPQTGQIIVMVGSRDYFDKQYEGNFNITLAKRQPGSAFKPFVYATAFKKGYTPQTVVFDLKTEFNSSCNPDGTPKPDTDQKECYQPENYDHVYRGPITLKEALAQSINIPAVKTLYLAGINDSLNTAKDLGITTLGDSLRYGLTLVLGGGEVTLLEMTSAYSVFANNGIKNPPTGILKIENSDGFVLEEFTHQSKEVLGKEIAYTINDILSDNNARAPAFGEASWLYFKDREVAVKTGTTNDYKDAWVMGYTPNFTLGLWIGNNNAASMEKKVAGFIAAPLWNSFFQKVFETMPKENFIKPMPVDTFGLKPVLRGYWQGGNTYFVDKISKKLATEYTPDNLKEERILTQIHSILYWLGRREEPQFVLWETPIREWVKNQNIKEDTEADVPTEIDDVHKPEHEPMVNILSPAPYSVFKTGDVINIKMESMGRFPLKKVDLYLEDFYIGSTSSLKPIHEQGKTNLFYEFAYQSNISEIKKPDNSLRLIIYDEVENKKEFSVFIVLENKSI